MNLLAEDYELFDRDCFTFKQLKIEKTKEEIEEIKGAYKSHWQKWKALQLQVANCLPAEYLMSQPKIESWTNGWNLRNHFWSAYRSEHRKAENACLAVLLNKKQYQIYLMFQHYKSDKREGSIEAYNQLLSSLKGWSDKRDCRDYYIWPQVEHELEDHLPLSCYLESETLQKEFTERLSRRTFQIGKLFYKIDERTDIEQLTREALEELAPLYTSIQVYE
ncbi:hypothetical protein IGI37_000476 [Enterococcus sp. AZ194]|uniref:HI_0552 family protein n=1 Tax=Enterococcus sp. AZ194 TaxID=2774629 RepID=UPI003F1FF97D